MLHGISDEIEVLEDKQDEPIEYDVSKILYSSGAQWTAFFEEYGYDVMEKAIYDVYEEVKKLFYEKGMFLQQLFEKRYFNKQYHLFGGMQNLRCVGALLSRFISNKCFHRNGKEYIVYEGKITHSGFHNDIEIWDRKGGDFRSYRVRCDIIGYYMAKYMENYLRIMKRYKYKCNPCVCSFGILEANDSNVPKNIISDFKKVEAIIKSGELRKATYRGMDIYFAKHEDEKEYWSS